MKQIIDNKLTRKQSWLKTKEKLPYFISKTPAGGFRARSTKLRGPYGERLSRSFETKSEAVRYRNAWLAYFKPDYLKKKQQEAKMISIMK